MYRTGKDPTILYWWYWCRPEREHSRTSSPYFSSSLWACLGLIEQTERMEKRGITLWTVQFYETTGEIVVCYQGGARKWRNREGDDRKGGQKWAEYRALLYQQARYSEIVNGMNSTSFTKRRKKGCKTTDYQRWPYKPLGHGPGAFQDYWQETMLHRTFRISECILILGEDCSDNQTGLQLPQIIKRSGTWECSSTKVGVNPSTREWSLNIFSKSLTSLIFRSAWKVFPGAMSSSKDRTAWNGNA